MEILDKEETKQYLVPRKKRGPKWLVICLVISLMLGSGLAGSMFTAIYFSNMQVAQTTESPLITDINQIHQQSYAFEPIFMAETSTLTLPELFIGANPAVVAISTQTQGTNIFGRSVTLPSAGSGFIISPDGYIVTNDHVIHAATAIAVVLYDGTTVPAEVVGRSPANDLAVLKIDRAGLTYLTFGDSNSLLVGEQVAAIGNPLGEFANSMTVGYVSALNRNIGLELMPSSLIQTDAAVNRGNSGGPLLNNQGEVIGVVSAKYMGQGAEGLGFAIPSNLTSEIVDILINGNTLRTGQAVMGVSIGTVYTEDGSSWVRIEYTLPDGAAYRAGILAGDIVVEADGIEIRSFADLRQILDGKNPGDTLELTIMRDGRGITVSVTLDAHRE